MNVSECDISLLNVKYSEKTHSPAVLHLHRCPMKQLSNVLPTDCFSLYFLPFFEVGFCLVGF